MTYRVVHKYLFRLRTATEICLFHLEQEVGSVGEYIMVGRLLWHGGCRQQLPLGGGVVCRLSGGRIALGAPPT